jgi:hypothetical protein
MEKKKRNGKEKRNRNELGKRVAAVGDTTEGVTGVVDFS